MLLKNCHVHVVGLGLMGASLAMALRGKVGHLSGSDLRLEIEQSAVTDGVIHEICPPNRADLVVVAVPADYIGAVIQRLELKPEAVLMDLGSTKTQICLVMDALPETIQAVGGHPMCGLAENGYHNAIPTLYAGARFILCETQRTSDTARMLCEQVVATVGAYPIWMDRQRHDQLAGAISHLPHLMSFALMRLAMEMAENDHDVWELAAGGFDGATRLARTDETMITGMFRTNADQLRKLASLLQEHMNRLIALLDEPEQLRAELTTIVNARRNYTQHYGERMIT
jgi:prephenate dehydrogenase